MSKVIEIQMEMQGLELDRRSAANKLSVIESRLSALQAELYGALLDEAIEAKNWPTVLQYYRTFFVYMDIKTFTMLADAGFNLAQTPLQFDGIIVENENHDRDTRYAIPDLLGFTITHIQRIDDDAIIFTRSDGQRVKMHHKQECCESVYIESIVGDLDALIGKPLTIAEVTSNYTSHGDDGDEQWTFYRLGTDIGSIVTIRWCGESSGYYSTSVDVGVM